MVSTPIGVDTDMEEDVEEWQTVLPKSRKKKVLMKLKASSGKKRESLKGSSAFKHYFENVDLDRDKSGMKVAHTLARLTQGGIHEFVNNVPPDMVQALRFVPNVVTSLQKVLVESSSSSAVGLVAIESCG